MPGMCLAGRDGPGSSQKREGRICVRALFPLRTALFQVLLGTVREERAWQALHTEKPGFESRLLIRAGPGKTVDLELLSMAKKTPQAVSGEEGKTFLFASTVQHLSSSPLCKAPEQRAACCFSLMQGTVGDCMFSSWHAETLNTYCLLLKRPYRH